MNECSAERRALAAQLNNMREVFIALGGANRQSIFLALLDGNSCGMRVGQLAKLVHLSRPAVSHHLKILKGAGLVAIHSEGTRNYYYSDANSGPWDSFSLLMANVDAVIAFIRENGCQPFGKQNLRPSASKDPGAS